eukprot:4038650-Pleurochrysis_carterae.AAC.1
MRPATRALRGRAAGSDDESHGTPSEPVDGAGFFLCDRAGADGEASVALLRFDVFLRLHGHDWTASALAGSLKIDDDDAAFAATSCGLLSGGLRARGLRPIACFCRARRGRGSHKNPVLHRAQ